MSDNINTEKILGTDDQCTQVLTCALNKIIKQEEMSPNSWALSKTVMVPKKKKPTIRDLRPIALTNNNNNIIIFV